MLGMCTGYDPCSHCSWRRAGNTAGRSHQNKRCTSQKALEGQTIHGMLLPWAAVLLCANAQELALGIYGATGSIMP